jgi:YtkA-like
MYRHISLVVLIFLLLTGIACAKEYEVIGKAGIYSVVVKFDKSLPVKGDNQVEISVKDTGMKPVTDAVVAVNYLMPSLPGKSAMMEYKTTAAFDRGKYVATADLSMSGEWAFLISISRAGKTETMRFNLIVK